MLAYLVTGQTYPNRRALRAAGAMWRAESRGYLLPPDRLPKIAALVESGALVIAETEAPDDAFAPLDGEALRAHREARRERRATRLIARAEAAERRAETARARISPAERDFLALGEPVKVGHHSERRHRRLIARADQAFMDTGRELDAAQRLRARAESLAPARIAGDAEREREAQRAARAAEIAPGDLVKHPIYGDGVVKRANAKTFTVAFTRGFVMACDKSSVTLCVKQAPAGLPAPKFAPGDLVTAHRLAARYAGVVRRRTVRGYSVQFESFGRTHNAVFSECDLEPRQPEA